MEYKEKIWQVMPEVSSDFVKKYPEYSRVVLQLLYNRGLKERRDIEQFLNPDYAKHIFNPFLFNNMAAAVDLIISHIKKGNKIVVYGDYDADGVTAAAVLLETLTTLKAKADVYIPDRVSEGYGLNQAAIDEIKEGGAKLIITVDGGIRGRKETEYARSLGLDIIITDHHIPPEEKSDWPDCLIINPMIGAEKYPFRFLAGVGVAFKLAQAVIIKSKLPDEDKLKLEERNLDLLAIGTVADCVALFGENRVLVKRGLEMLNKTKRKGLRELFKTAKIAPEQTGRSLDSWNIGFQIAPRLNAAGRMDHANTAFELLTTKDGEEAGLIARRLNDKNIERQNATQEIVSAVEEQIGEESKDKIIIGVCPPDLETEAWNEGVIGLVAGRISDKYYKPTLIITNTKEGLKGSGRSVEEFDMMKAVSEVGEFLDKFGGHKMACGFSLRSSKLPGFKKRITEIANEKLKDIDLRPKIKIEAELALEDINEELAELVDKFSPFGQENSRPKFVSYGIVIADIVNMGVDGSHIKLKLRAGTEGNTGTAAALSALGFGQAERWKSLRIGDKIDMVYYIEINKFNGRTEAQLRIADIKKSNE